MPRINRVDIGNLVYHVINRSNARMRIFRTKNDYLAFEKALEEANEKFNMRILGYCVMPNHWHLVLYPKHDGDLSDFMRWLSMTHTQRWHVAHNTTGSGHLYQGRYKSFVVEKNEYFYILLRYVERNPLRANLVEKAEDWRWSSLWCRLYGDEKQKKLLSEWPVDTLNDYLKFVNTAQTEKEVEALRCSVNKGKPFGSDKWIDRIIDRFNLGATLRGKGRPKKGS